MLAWDMTTWPWTWTSTPLLVEQSWHDRLCELSTSIYAKILSLALFFFLSWLTTAAQPASLILFIAVSFKELLGDFWPMGVLLWKNCQNKSEFTILAAYFLFFKPSSSSSPSVRGSAGSVERRDEVCVRMQNSVRKKKSTSASLVFHSGPNLILTADNSGSRFMDKTRSPWYHSDQSCQNCGPALWRSYSSPCRHQMEAFLFCKTGVHFGAHVNKAFTIYFAMEKKVTRRTHSDLCYSPQPSFTRLGSVWVFLWRQRNSRWNWPKCVYKLYESHMKWYSLNSSDQFIHREIIIHK